MGIDLGDALLTAFGTVIPAVAIVGGIVSHLIGDHIGVFAEFVTRDDERADEALDDLAPSAPLGRSGENFEPAAAAYSESEPLLGHDPHPAQQKTRRSKKSVLLAALGLIELALLLFLVVRIVARTHSAPSAEIIFRLIIWAYAFLLPIFKPSVTPYYSLFVVYASSLIALIIGVSVSGLPISNCSGGVTAHCLSLFFTIGNASLFAVALSAILSMPMRETAKVPEKNAAGLNPALDDWSTFGQWMTFSWLNMLIERGKTMPLEEVDVWQLSRNLRSRVLLRKLELIEGSSFLIRILKANAHDLLLVAALTMSATTLMFGQLVVQNRFLRAMERLATESTDSISLRYLARHPLVGLSIMAEDLGLSQTYSSFDDPGRRNRRDAYLWAGIAFLASLIKAELDLQNWFIGRRSMLRVKSEAIASVYLKATKRIDTSGAVGEDGKASGADMGKITSLVSTDTNRLGNFMNTYTQLIQTPLSVILSASFLYQLMGWSAFAGYVMVLVAIPANHYLMKWEYNVLQVALEMRDRRVRSMNELIQAIKFIKFSGWETHWLRRILEHRERELHQSLLQKLTMFFTGVLWQVVPIFVACISLGAFTYVAGHELSVSIAFPAITAFGILTDELTSLPQFGNVLQRIYASVVRMGDFLDEEEVPPWARGSEQESSALAYDDRLGCEGATFVWNTTSIRPSKLLAVELKKKKEAERRASRRSWVQLLTLRKKQPPAVQLHTHDESATLADATPRTPEGFTLRDISVVFPRGKLSLIYGPTGSGKSSLLSALLGEMKLIEGHVYLPKYPTRVDPTTGLCESISFCAQHPWLEHKSIKDNILFGSPYDEKRYNAVLSACALVPDLKILEDGDRTEIGEKGISLSGGQKARVALARAVYARSQTVILDDILSAVDTHTANILIHRCFLGPLMKGRTLVLVTHHTETIMPHADFVVQMSNGVIETQGTSVKPLIRGKLRTEDDVEAELAVESDVRGAEAEVRKEPRKLVEQETKASGSVKVNLYLIYLKAAGYWLVGLLLLTIFLQRSSDLMQKFWIKAWSESYESYTANPHPPFGFPSATYNPLPYVAVYIAIQFFNALFSILTSLPNIYSELSAARTLYQRMLESVLRSPIRWFDKTPTGRILNRFASDIDTVDSGLTSYFWAVGEQILSFFLAIGTIVYGVPPFLVFAVFLGYMHYYFANGYVKTSRDLNRLEATLRSPIISLFSELLVGVATVRAFGAEMRLMRVLFDRLDRCQAAFYYTWMTNFWLRFRFAILGALTFFFTTMTAITIGISPGLMAIVITQAYAIIGYFYFGMRAYVSAEQAFNVIERITEYIELPPEPPRITSTRPPANWPSPSGGIIFTDVSIKYDADLEPVLKDLTFTIRPREKIGLVGRTGAGKSTLAHSLFRFVDPAQGRIEIDGVDLTAIGVEDLRTRLMLIPQDAVLFKGTVRENLDPFNEYSDAECLDVLRAVQLPVDTESDFIVVDGTTSQPEAGSKLVVTLDSQVSEGGNNWSAGQRQLLAMARALLRKSRIVVLDESTASVDFESDKKIQHAIRAGFYDSIMLIIAHRLHTVIECDRLIVLDAGRVVEFDTPLNLIEKKGGVFRAMCEKSESFDALYTAAKEAARRE